MTTTTGGGADLAARIRALEDRAEIAELRAQYCHVLDDRDWDGLAALFTEDGEFEGLAHAVGRTEVHRFFSETVARLGEGYWHFCTNPTLTLDGDRATGRISMEYLSVTGGVSYVSAGHYVDTLLRVDGRWKFRKRKISFYYFAPLAQGFTGRPTFINIDGTPRVPQPN
ncbi:nuclear transport factor 2 family protein [Frigidibacter sp. MR17.24]|uniref:nuclear transport factor 2 family protein n=1 Tax=Frigidibacter sp. MR17.24 TaxID=3127345 RepID=UPI003013066B